MTTPADETDEVQARDITREEAWAMLDEWCQEYLGIGVQEFARRYHAGAYDDPDDDLKIMRLAIFLESLEEGARTEESLEASS